ncbi:hypothetical protein LOK49_LG14G01181 [Camellia lanceoleosa]|uniref:Uncharacterized protein n=1 Tax=Camellia lanceoleosa TaxID=1840588 RepID=A0ACC0FEG3_9ERIC|nr:hypothetical protein LOK49_LG14G01181 [Camellia lanceoleosa]
MEIDVGEVGPQNPSIGISSSSSSSPGEALNCLVSIQTKLGEYDIELLELLKRVLAIQEKGVDYESEKSPLYRRLWASVRQLEYIYPHANPRGNYNAGRKSCLIAQGIPWGVPRILKDSCRSYLMK